MILDEVEPIGGFIGVSVSEPLLQGGILVSVIGYMLFLEPSWRCLASPSSCRRWCSCRCCSGDQPPRATRILTKRGISGGSSPTAAAEHA